MRAVKRWFKYARPYLPYFIIGPICMIVEVVGEMMLPKFLAQVINNGVGVNSGTGAGNGYGADSECGCDLPWGKYTGASGRLHGRSGSCAADQRNREIFLSLVCGFVYQKDQRAAV